jgi:tetratricopeptide (TPR) repeat protein
MARPKPPCCARYRLAAALEAAERVVAIRRSALKPADPLLAASLNNLAAIHGAMGRRDEAESEYMQALRIREASLGPDHPDVAISLNNIATLKLSAGQYDAAESLVLRALDIQQRNLPDDHPDVAVTLRNYAAVMRATGRDAETLILDRQAQAIEPR